MATCINVCFLVFSLALLPSVPVRAEMFTALVHMEGLVALEKELLAGLESYLQVERERLNRIEKFGNQVRMALEAAGSDPTAHLYDPVNAFQLVNRYINGWGTIHEDIYEDNEEALMANISYNQYRFPGEEDFSGAATALLRLQDTYRLSPSLISSGKLGSASAVSMTSEDCYHIGRSAYNDEDFYHTRDWMKEALRLFDEEGDTSDLDLTLVYDHLSYAEYKLGNIKKAAHYTRLLLQNEPTHTRAQGNIAYFERLMSSEPDKYIDVEEEEEPESESEMTEHERYESLCRAPWPLPKEDHHQLICFYYNNRRTPGLLLQPAKVEIAFPNPRIYIIRDIISETEMKRLKELAGPILQRATARNAASGKFEPAHYRISKSGWLSSEDDPMGYVDRIDKRIEYFTGLTMKTAEQLQVVNYGIGGHYEPHYDFARVGEDAFTSLGSGNRIATVLFYMSDVELGGATVFPLIGARILPSKGDAAFWWNLKKSGEGDLLTRHAGCPVLVGSKWVCNKWIHERGQEFRRPCGLSPEE